MTTDRSRLPLVYLKPGELAIFEEPAKVTTVLGSCVSVTIHCRRTGAGAISHSTMPVCNLEKKCGGFCGSNAFRYVSCALRFMLAFFEISGVTPGELEIKLFGGADSMAKPNPVGTQNINIALQIIKAAGLTVTAADVGDIKGRKIIFFPHTGEVLLKRLKSSSIAQCKPSGVIPAGSRGRRAGSDAAKD